MVIMKIGDNIRKIRKSHSLSQDKLCKLADVTLTTLAKIESGKNDNPTIKTLVKISKALDVNVDALVKNEK